MNVKRTDTISAYGLLHNKANAIMLQFIARSQHIIASYSCWVKAKFSLHKYLINDNVNILSIILTVYDSADRLLLVEPLQAKEAYISASAIVAVSRIEKISHQVRHKLQYSP